MSAQQIKVVKKAVRPPDCATIGGDEARTLWLAVLHGLTIITAALRKYLGLDGRCEHCGR